MNNDQQVIQEIKNKIKYINDLFKTIFYRVSVITQSVNHSKSRETILTSIKEVNILVESCFICHKSDHSFKECFNQSTRINAVNNEYDYFDFDLNFDSKN